MPTAQQQIIEISNLIDSELAGGLDERGLAAQKISGHLRNLVEATIIACDKGANHFFDYDYVSESKTSLGADHRFKNLIKFHDVLQVSFSHYTLDSDTSARLVMKYIQYLLQLRDLCRVELDLTVLQHLERFPLDLDPALSKYHEQISEAISNVRLNYFEPLDETPPRFYIDRVRPFFVNWKIYYEVTYRNATDFSDKYDREIAFTDVDIPDRYAAQLRIVSTTISVAGQELPIRVVTGYRVAIRPTELTRLAQYLSPEARKISVNREYWNLADYLTASHATLLDIVLLPESRYRNFQTELRHGAENHTIDDTLSRARHIIKRELFGQNVLRYLLWTMDNRILRQQEPTGYSAKILRDHLLVSSRTYPFEIMPFASSLVGHRPRTIDRLSCIPNEGREHEFLNHRVQMEAKNNGQIYIPVRDLVPDTQSRAEAAELIQPLINRFNSKTWNGNPGRKMALKMGHVFIREYEDTIGEIIRTLQSKIAPDSNYQNDVESWIGSFDRPGGYIPKFPIDDKKKLKILPQLFAESKVAFLYGAAGTGKSTMVNMVAEYFEKDSKLFLAQTNPAVDNLKRRVVNHSNSEFRTVSSYNARAGEEKYNLVIIDEASTVDNKSLLTILKCTDFDHLLIVGDNFQIESIEFGNWFEIAREYMPESSTFELETPHRTDVGYLQNLWKSVREMNGKVDEYLGRGGVSTELDESFFSLNPTGSRDEITLCLNYDGLYGINNINNFMQSMNTTYPYEWNNSVYKVGDPVLFTDSERYRGLVFNNLKGRIVNIETTEAIAHFDVEIDRTEAEVASGAYGIPNVTHLEGSIVRFEVTRYRSTEDEDSFDSSNRVPFAVAYAVSIHKAQGLEYDSVRLVITADSEERISHSIFYTAITRARKQLRIFWSPEAQRKIIDSFSRPDHSKTIGLLRSRKLI